MTEREIGKSYAMAEALRELLEASKSAVRTLEVACFEGDAEQLREAIRRYEEAKRG